MKMSEQINELASAMSKAQGEIKGAVKDAQNPFFKSNYADLASVWEACRLPLSKNGLSVIQTLDGEAGAIRVITTLAHSSGQWMQSSLPIAPKAQDAQAIGSAISYARRYALAAITGVYQIDDDGEVAMNRPEQANKATKPIHEIKNVTQAKVKPF